MHLSMLLLQPVVALPQSPKCVGVLVPSGNGKTALVSFRIAGTAPELQRIRTAALKIGAKAQPPVAAEGRMHLFVFFESTVDPTAAVQLYNNVDNGMYHPGTPKEKIEIERMTLPPDIYSRKCGK